MEEVDDVDAMVAICSSMVHVLLLARVEMLQSDSDGEREIEAQLETDCFLCLRTFLGGVAPQLSDTFLLVLDTSVPFFSLLFANTRMGMPPALAKNLPCRPETHRSHQLSDRVRVLLSRLNIGGF